MDQNERILSKLRKLLALARQGVGGEKDNAQSVLEKLLARHNLTLEDLDDEHQEQETYWFKPVSDQEHGLLVQCVATTVPSWDGSVWRMIKRKATDRTVGVKLTAAQFAEVDLLFTIHRRAFADFLAEQTKNVLRAYVEVNNLYRPKPAAEAEKERAEPTLSLADIEAILAMASRMKPTPVRKALACGSPA